MVETFEDLKVYQRAYAISLEVHKVSKSFPSDEQRGMASQMRRASKSICANLAEGFGKQALSKAEFARFVMMAVGSADEMQVWCSYARDLGLIDTAKAKLWNDEYLEIAKMLQGGLHRSLR